MNSFIKLACWMLRSAGGVIWWKQSGLQNKKAHTHSHTVLATNVIAMRCHCHSWLRQVDYSIRSNLMHHSQVGVRVLSYNCNKQIQVSIFTYAVRYIYHKHEHMMIIIIVLIIMIIMYILMMGWRLWININYYYYHFSIHIFNNDKSYYWHICIALSEIWFRFMNGADRIYM